MLDGPMRQDRYRWIVFHTRASIQRRATRRSLPQAEGSSKPGDAREARRTSIEI